MLLLLFLNRSNTWLNGRPEDLIDDAGVVDRSRRGLEFAETCLDRSGLFSNADGGLIAPTEVRFGVLAEGKEPGMVGGRGEEVDVKSLGAGKGEMS
jgi:hypothetical protein